jgi:anti-sigma-K factor RskA
VTCDEVVALAGARALEALEPDERAAIDAHLAGPGPHQGCREAVDRARDTAAELASALPEVRPDPAVWAAIAARAGATSGAAPARRPRIGPVGWAAAVAAAAALAVVWVDRRELRRERADAERARAELRALAGAAELQREALALLDRPGSRVVPLEPQPGQVGRAVAVVSEAAGRAVVVSSSLPPRPGKTYQLWVIRGTGAPQPAGFLAPATGGTAAGEIDRRLLAGAPPDALAVSLEPEGGSPSPTEVVLVGRVSG